jgi:hypothetical protein
MAPQDFSLFIEPPIPSSNRVKSSSNFIESPVKTTKRKVEQNQFISPQRQTKRARASDFIASPNASTQATSRGSSRRRDRLRKSCKNRDVTPIRQCTDWEGICDGGLYSDGGGFEGGFGESSPEKGYVVKDTIDWSITGDEVEELKRKVVPAYWELLLNSANAVVRVTKRLYILQDWNRLGFLLVTNQYIYQADMHRNGSTGMFTE